MGSPVFQWIPFLLCRVIGFIRNFPLWLNNRILHKSVRNRYFIRIITFRHIKRGNRVLHKSVRNRYFIRIITFRHIKRDNRIHNKSVRSEDYYRDADFEQKKYRKFIKAQIEVEHHSQPRGVTTKKTEDITRTFS